jgi:sulfane dehydrogenase subunit SoxC
MPDERDREDGRMIEDPAQISRALAEPTRWPERTKASRRAFLQGGVAGLAALATQARAETPGKPPSNVPPNVPEWTKTLGPGVVANPYGLPSPFEKNVVRRNVPWLTATTESSVAFTPLQDLDGIITPSGLCFERHHGGVPDIDPAQHRLIIHGLVERPLMFDMNDLTRFPSVSRICFIECPANTGMEWKGAQLNGVQFTKGMVHCCEWTGVKLSTVLAEAGIRKGATWLLAEGADAAAMTRSLPVEKALDDTILAYSQNGERIRPEQGYPLRFVVPGWEGNLNVKWLRRIEVGDRPWHHREETSKYTDLMADGKAREFTFVQEANSVITFPCPEKPLKTKGFYEVRGLAWSGRGKITKVDVSFDGGRNWREASLQEPVLDKALTRFRLAWMWDGAPGFLQSRAMDETGYVQPTIHQLRKVRGLNSIYHNNSIQTWRLNAEGTLDNVQVM